MLRDQLKTALTDAMRAKDTRAVSTVRLILAALKDRDIAARDKGTTEGISDEEIRAQRGGGRGFVVIVIGTDIANMRKGEGDDLSGVGRVGQDFLIPGHRGVEADLTDRGGCGT